MKEQIQFIGAGKLGTSLARAMFESGWMIPVFWVKNNLVGDEALTYLPQTVFKIISEPHDLKLADVLILTVPDDQIRKVADHLCSFDICWSEKIIIHTSGCLNKEELTPLKNRGAIVGSIHPMQTFNKKFLPPVVFKNIYFAVEGNDSVLKFGEKLVGVLRSKKIKIQSNQKTIYHTAAVAASNFFVGLLNYCETLFKHLNIEETTARKIIMPIVKNTLDNYKKSTSQLSLTGPLSRGDVKVVANQLSHLEHYHKDLLPIYAEISRYIFKFMIKEGTDNYNKIEKLLTGNND